MVTAINTVRSLSYGCEVNLKQFWGLRLICLLWIGLATIKPPRIILSSQEKINGDCIIAHCKARI